MVPEACSPGTRLVFDSDECVPDEEINPKKKLWDKLAVDFKTNEIGEAMWKNNYLLTPSGEKLISKFCDCQIK